MAEPKFLSIELALVIQQMQLAQFGGAAGVRDIGMLDSALSRPVNRWAYEQPSIPRMAADYAFGIARNHPFVDGNKRAAFMCAYTFLRMNGYSFGASEAEVMVAILALASGELAEAELIRWFESNSIPMPEE